MENTAVRGSHPALIQVFETRSHWAPVETQLRVHFHSHHGSVDHENFPARLRTDHGWARAVSRPAGWPYSLLAGRGCFYGDLCLRDRDYDLREQKSSGEISEFG